MALVFSESQAIKFLQSGETSFNSTSICSCGADREEWAYAVTAGDTIDFQILSNCELSDELILNGSFETGTGDDFTDSEWTRALASAENTNLTRITSNSAQCGQYLAFWDNEASTPNTASITQTYAGGFTTGSVYKFTIKAKIVEASLPTNSNASILKLTIGGQIYYITPTTEWTDYTIIVTFNTAPANDDIKIEINTAAAANISEMYVDCVTLNELQGCCIKGLVNNSNFENGQNLDGEIVATVDNWNLTNATVLDTGGRNDTRGVSLNGIGSILEQENVLLDNTTHVIKFWAKADALPASISVYAGANLIGATALTLEWAEYSFTYDNVNDEDISFEQDETDETIYIDDVTIASIPLLNIFINNLEADEIILINASDITAYSDHINVSIPVNDYDMPTCFNICVESCLENLISNGNFEDGSGDTFTNWTKSISTATNEILQSQTLDNASWLSFFPIIPNDTTAPDGTATADKIEEQNCVGCYTGVYQDVTEATNKWCFSVYLKADERDLAYLVLQDNVGTYYATWFDLSNGLVLTNNNDLADIENVGNGWYRCWIFQNSINLGGGSARAFIGVTDADGVEVYDCIDGYGLHAWGAQLEKSSSPTSYKKTTTTAVTESEGSIVSETGIGGTRAPQFNTETLPISLYQLSTSIGVAYRLRFYAKDVTGSPTLLVTDGTTTYESFIIDSATFEVYETELTATGTNLYFTVQEQNKSFILDDVELVETPVSSNCSEDFKYFTELDPCMKELVWYDNNDEAMDIVYSTGFQNKVRVKAQLTNPQYIKSNYVKTLNGETSSINSFKMKKTNELGIDNIPEFLLDRISLAIGVSNIEYGGVELCSTDESEVTAIYEKSTNLLNANIVLSPKGEFLGERNYNC